MTFTDNGDGTATLAGTPTGNVGGTYSFTITADNSVGSDATQTFALSVDQAPAITSADSTTFTVGQAGSFTVQTTGVPVATLNDGNFALPSGVTFADNGNGTVTLAGTPAAASGGTYSFTITADNGVGSDAMQTFTLTVDQAPAITSADNTTFTVGQDGSFTVNTTGFPVAALNGGDVALPSGVTFTDNGNGTATLAGTPTGNAGGIYSFAITAHNGVGSDATQSFTLTVDQAPAIASADNTTFTVGQPGSFTVQTTGFPISTLNDGNFSLPSGVTFTDNGDGTATLAGTPTGNVGGIYPLTITAHNGIGNDATQSFTLSVDQAPSFTSPAATTFIVGTHGAFTIATGPEFPTATSLSETGSLPAGVTFTDNGNGTATLSGTPMPGSGNSYPITLTAHNGVAPDATQTFTVTDDEAPSVVSLPTGTFVAGQASSFTVRTLGYPRPALSDGSATLPAGVTFVDNGNGTATLSGTPAMSTGVYPIVLTGGNGVGPAVAQSFGLTVVGAPVFTSADDATFIAGQVNTFAIMTTPGIPTTTTVTETGKLPAGVTFTRGANGTATLRGKPQARTGGIWTIALTASSGAFSSTQSFTLAVDQAPVFPTAKAAATIGVGQTTGLPVFTATGLPTASYRITGTLPAGMKFQDDGDGTAQLIGRRRLPVASP